MSKYLGTALLCLSLTAAATAQTTSPNMPTNAPNMAGAHDEKIESLVLDLHALDRVATLAKDLNDQRQVMLAIIDADVTMLRGPRDDGTYKWASLQREEGSRVTDEKSIERVQTEKELREVTITATNAYRLLVTVPTKRNLLNANNRVYVRNVIVDSTGFDGKTAHSEIPVNAWVNPGDSNGVALPEIGRTVKATAELGVESGEKKAVAQVALLQAKLVDDPASPYFPAAKRLLQIRELVAAKDMQRGAIKSSIDEALLSLPGELERRTAAQRAAEEQRRQAATTGATKGSIAIGDATPDVVAALADIARQLGGTLDEQTAARTKLKSLIETLKPTPPTTSTP